MKTFVPMAPVPDHELPQPITPRPGFAYELVVIALLLILSPALQATTETGPGRLVREVEGLQLLLPWLVCVIGLCVSVLRNRQRSVTAKSIAAPILVIAILYSLRRAMVLWPVFFPQ